MSETPRTDKMFDIWTVSPDALEFTRALEKEINHLQKYTDDIRKKLTAAEAQVEELRKALSSACPDDIEELCDECAPGPCIGCWVKDARSLIDAAKESG